MPALVKCCLLGNLTEDVQNEEWINVLHKHYLRMAFLLHVMGGRNVMLWSSSTGILGAEQWGVCTDDGELLLLCHPCHQKPPHLHAILNPQRAQDGQLPEPSGKGQLLFMFSFEAFTLMFLLNGDNSMVLPSCTSSEVIGVSFFLQTKQCKIIKCVKVAG